MDPRSLLREFGISPKRSLGQNFLIDESAALRIVAAAELRPDDVVLEIGPGLGALTLHLAADAQRVIAVELDQRLIPVLHRNLDEKENVQIIHGDILHVDPAKILPAGYKAVANIPYYITSALLRHLLEADVCPSLMVLTVQEEVARRIVAGPGNMSLLAVSVQFYGQPRIVARLKAGAFYPKPKVDSAVVQIDLRAGARSAPDVRDVEFFFRLARAGFGKRRKQLRNALASGLTLPHKEVEAALAAADIDPQRRAETLSVDEWAALVEGFRGLVSDS
jgi:16S rRNA (adenine1518-N6/adenine1519-N6)-dimethyltransferase